MTTLEIITKQGSHIVGTIESVDAETITLVDLTAPSLCRARVAWEDVAVLRPAL